MKISLAAKLSYYHFSFPPYSSLYKRAAISSFIITRKLNLQMAGSTGGDLSVLPEGCVANVLSFTGPLDVGRLSIVSSTFKSAAESDAVWEQFLPPEYHSIISESSDSSLLACSSSKKELYLHLCDNPVLIEDGKKVPCSF